MDQTGETWPGPGQVSETINIGKYWEVEYNSTTVQHTPIWIYLILYSHKLQVWNCLLSSTLENLGEGVERETLQPGEDQDQQRDHVGPPQPQQQLRGGVRAELPRPGETQHPARAQQSASQQSHEVILLWRGRWWAGGLVESPFILYKILQQNYTTALSLSLCQSIIKRLRFSLYFLFTHLEGGNF